MRRKYTANACTCSCPLGRVGTDCGTVAIPACRLAGEEEAPLDCPHKTHSLGGAQWAVSCECIRQCEALYNTKVPFPSRAQLMEDSTDSTAPLRFRGTPFYHRL